jgi:hypothetical protein
LIPCGSLAAAGHLVAHSYTVLIGVNVELPGVFILSERENVSRCSGFAALRVFIVVLIKGASIR